MRNRVVIAAIAGIVAIAAFVGAAPAVRLPRLASIANVTSAAAKLLDVRAPKAPAVPAAAAVGAGSSLEAATTDTLVGVLGSFNYVAESQIVFINNNKLSSVQTSVNLLGYVTSSPYYDTCAYDADNTTGRELTFFKQTTTKVGKKTVTSWTPLPGSATTVSGGGWTYTLSGGPWSSLVILASVDAYDTGVHPNAYSCGATTTKFTFKIERPRNR